MSTKTKQCSKCKRVFSVEQFSIDRAQKSGLYPSCKDCTCKMSKKYRQEYKLEIQKKSKVYRQNNKAKIQEVGKMYRQDNKRKEQLRHKKYYAGNREKLLVYAKKQYLGIRRNCDYELKYNITIRDYDEMFEKQNGVCAICGLPEITRRLSIDHDHKTGRVRGLLCVGCNITLGHAKENIERLRSMIAYLKKHEDVEVGIAGHG